MKISNEELFEKILEPKGFKVGDCLAISGCVGRFVINDNYELSNGISEIGLSILLEADFRKIERAPKEVHEELKRLANGFEPDWANEYQGKYHIIYYPEHDLFSVDSTWITKYRDTVYFKTKEEANSAIKNFSRNELKGYFG